MRFTLLYIIFSGISSLSLAQKKIFQKANYYVGTQANISSSSQTPFWLRTNKNGTVPINGNNFSIFGRSTLEYDSLYSKNGQLHKFNIGYCLETYANVGKNIPRFILSEAYVKARLGIFELWGGRRKEIVGLTDTTSSSGSFAISNNALPIPQIKLSIPNYVPVLGNGLVSMKGSYSQGWYGKQNYLSGVMLHHKSLYFKIGRAKWKTSFIGGFNHQVQFGGRLQKLSSLSSVKNGYFPQSFRDYIYAVTGISLGKQAIQETIQTDKYTGYDLTNRVGNHLGTIDIGMNIELSALRIFLYRQSFYDDGSLFYLNNLNDGLNGLTIINKSQGVSKKLKFLKLTIEYFNSSSQGGPIAHFQTVNPYIRGWDDYYNHGQFLDGWANKRNSLGSPFIVPQTTVLTILPSYINNVSGDIPFSYFSNNNRVKAFHAYVLFVLGRENYLGLRSSFSSNLGTYRHPFTNSVHQFSEVLEYRKKMKKSMFLSTSFEFDSRGVFKKNAGIQINIMRRL